MVGFFDRSSVLGASCLFFFGLLCFCCFSLVSVEGSVVVEWMLVSGGMEVSFPVVVDGFSLLFSFVVIVISFLVVVFSTSYMDGEENLSRFIWLVMLFVLSMNFLIFVPSVIGVILGWDGLGLISFLLVIYYQNSKSLGAGLVTAFMNRVGDALLLLSVSLLSCVGHWYFWGIGNFGGLWVVILFVILLSTTKSAQFPFSYWLPAAMSAPTPVSALVHSSTLVTAGVYLMIRVVSGVGVYGGSGSLWLLIVSLFTMFMAGVSACFEVDMKKIVALSTLSQLGVMMFSLSLGCYALAFFHLVSHALFKALLFVGVGCVIHNHSDCQDFRMIGGLWYKMPLSSGSILLSGMALSGLPFLGGFYSKDLVVESCLGCSLNWVVFLVLVLGLFTTFVYMLRLYVSGVCGLVGGGVFQSVENLSFYEVVPMVGLGLASVFGGYLMQSFVFAFNEVVLLELGFKLVLFFLLLGGGFFVLISSFLKVMLFSVKGVVGSFFLSFFRLMWFSFQGVSSINSLVLSWGGLMYSSIDLGWNERVFGGLGLFDFLLTASNSVLGLWYGSVGYCLGGALVLVLLLVGWL